jgi:hypothetical protein
VSDIDFSGYEPFIPDEMDELRHDPMLVHTYDAYRIVAALIRAEQARADPCPHCSPRHEWPCPTIPRCDESVCEEEATCGWPSEAGYRHTCYEHWVK